MLRILGPRTGHVFEGHRRIKTKPLGNHLEAFGAKGTLGIDVDGLSLGAAFPAGHLAGNAEGVTELGFSGSEFSELSQTEFPKHRARCEGDD